MLQSSIYYYYNQPNVHSRFPSAHSKQDMCGQIYAAHGLAMFHSVAWAFVQWIVCGVLVTSTSFLTSNSAGNWSNFGNFRASLSCYCTISRGRIPGVCSIISIMGIRSPFFYWGLCDNLTVFFKLHAFYFSNGLWMKQKWNICDEWMVWCILLTLFLVDQTSHRIEQTYGGGPLNKQVGDKLVNAGVKIQVIYGT
jgi:hypothetical protein